MLRGLRIYVIMPKGYTNILLRFGFDFYKYSVTEITNPNL